GGRARRHQREGRGAMNEAAARPEDVSWREVRQVVEEQLALLPEKLRLPLIHCLFQGQTQEEAARYLGVSPRTLRDRLRRGRELLRARLTRRGVELSVLGVLLAGGSAQAAVPAALCHAPLAAAPAVVNKASLTGIASPSAISLAGSSSLLAGWAALPVAVVTLALLGSGAYLATHRSAHPQAAPAAARAQTVHRSFRGGQFDDGF